MSTGILVLTASIVLLGFATWMNSKNKDAGEGAAIWSIVQFVCVIAMLFGAFMIYMAIANPPKVPTEGAGF